MCGPTRIDESQFFTLISSCDEVTMTHAPSDEVLVHHQMREAFCGHGTGMGSSADRWW